MIYANFLSHSDIFCPGGENNTWVCSFNPQLADCTSHTLQSKPFRLARIHCYFYSLYDSIAQCTFTSRNLNSAGSSDTFYSRRKQCVNLASKRLAKDLGTTYSEGGVQEQELGSRDAAPFRDWGKKRLHSRAEAARQPLMLWDCPQNRALRAEIHEIHRATPNHVYSSALCTVYARGWGA